MQILKNNAVILYSVIFGALLALTAPAQAAKSFKPFVLAWRGTADFATKVEDTKQSLKAAKFQLVADVSPYPKGAYVDELRVLVFTSSELKRAAARSRHGGFAAAQRVAITRSGNDVQVTYVNPLYIAHAYRLKTDLARVAARLTTSLGSLESFGSEKGLTEHKLRKYHYTFGMEDFNGFYRLAKSASYTAAVTQVEKNLQTNTLGIRQAYRIDIPGKEETIIGVTRQDKGEKGQHYDDRWIMDEIDFGELRTTAYLPYEIMISGNEVIALHVRFRMAVHYPDLKMSGKNSFREAMSASNSVGKALTAAIDGK